MTPAQAPNRREVIYCAGPFTATETHTKDQNILRAIAQGKAVRALGLVPLVPHVAILGACTWQEGMDECLELLQRADGMLMLEDWRLSKGAPQERAMAEALGLPVFYSLSELELEREGNAPVTFQGRLRLFWLLLQEIAAREEAAGLPHPRNRKTLWIIKAGLWVIRVNPFEAAAVNRDTGQVTPPQSAGLEYAGQPVGILNAHAGQIRADEPSLFPGLLRALDREVRPSREVAS